MQFEETLTGLLTPQQTARDLLWDTLEDGVALAAGLRAVERPIDAVRHPEMSLAEYMRAAWHVLEPARALRWNWHLDMMCEHLEAVTAGQIRRLVINVPFGATKSLTACVMWQTWEWTAMPWTQWLFYSYNQDFSKRDTLKARRLIRSQWYASRWGHVYRLTSDQNEKTHYENSHTGFRMASSFGGAVTGPRGDRIVIDDPLKASDARSELKVDEVNRIFDEAISSRTNDPETSAFLVIAQRTTARDLPGHVLERDEWEHLSIPMEYEPRDPSVSVPRALDNRSRTSLNPVDPRKHAGELMDPVRFPRETVDELKRTLGSFAAAAQLQQRPVPAGGALFKRKWFRFWEPEDQDLGPVRLLMEDGTLRTVMPVKLPRAFDYALQSWDLTFDSSTSFVVGDAWAKAGARAFLLEQLRDNCEFPEQMEMIRKLTRMVPIAALKLVEAQANGKAAIASLRKQIPGLVPNPVTEGSKPVRSAAVSPYVEAGNVFLPHPALCPWVDDWLNEVCSFPFYMYNDRVDTMVQALFRMFGSSANRATGVAAGGSVTTM